MKIIKIILLGCLFFATSCPGRTLKFMRMTELEINPNPIVIKNGWADFEVVYKNRGRIYSKIDSIILEFLVSKNGKEHVVATSHYEFKENQSDKFSFKADSLTEDLLFTRVLTYSNANVSAGNSIEIAKIVNIDDVVQ